MARGTRKVSGIVWLRRCIQILCLLLFCYLFLQTAYHPINRPGGPVTLFFDLDPLILVATWLAGAAIPLALFLSVGTLLVTVFLGRWFCGWICPFGTLHQMMTHLRGGPTASRLKRADYSPRQRWKYLILIALLAGTLMGLNLVGWFDPFSLLYRSLTTAVFPAFNSGSHALFAWLYENDPGLGSAKVTKVSEPVYEVLRSHLLDEGRPQYFWGILIGIIFVGILALNLWRHRFWCRYICPLGALLGLAGKNPIIRLKKDETACTHCRACVAVCPSGANPDGPLDKSEAWKPAECLFCWNCEAVCPKQALSFELTVPSRKPS
ncbi:MAG: 4Fe-4S binding protein [Sedimentisphaerales bacterium]|nr:4Fe-4S binding protein [Sedimentisphaerales bacterium]